LGNVDYQQFYSEEAARYESTRYGSPYGRLFRLLQREAIKDALSDAEEPKRILDVATGTGQMLPVFRDTGALVVASDLTAAMLAEARRHRTGEDGVAYCVGDAFCLPYPDGQFDVVASSRFLHLFDLASQQLLLKEMARVMKPGGLLIVDFYSAHGRRWVWLPMTIYRLLLRKRPENDVRVTFSQARDMISACGLQPLRTQGLGNFLLALVPWLPLGWRCRSGEWLGRHCVRMSEQFLIVSRAP
jgi:ubiquinone/menaquinone biosynthesis C-methylase UbiE